MGVLAAFDRSTGTAPTVEQLRARMSGLEGAPRMPVPTHPALAGLVQLRTGGSYEVDGLGLAMLLMSGASRAGEWSAVVGAADFGAEAAAELGVDLRRTVLVPDPGEHWLEATAGLIGVATVVVLRPPASDRHRVEPRVADRLAARLRKHGSVLVVHGSWPGSEARLSLQDQRWSGIAHGHGRLRARRVVVSVDRGSAPPVCGELWLPIPPVVEVGACESRDHPADDHQVSRLVARAPHPSTTGDVQAVTA